MGEPSKTTRRYADAGTDATVADLMHSFSQHISEPILIEVDCAGEDKQAELQRLSARKDMEGRGGVRSLKTYFEFLSSEVVVVDDSVPPLVAIAGRQQAVAAAAQHCRGRWGSASPRRSGSNSHPMCRRGSPQHAEPVLYAGGASVNALEAGARAHTASSLHESSAQSS
jgi:hypothetical protein